MVEFAILSALLIAVIAPTARRRPEILSGRAYLVVVTALGFTTGVLLEALPLTYVGHNFSLLTLLTAVMGFLCGRQIHRALAGWSRHALANPPPEDRPPPRLVHPLIALGLIGAGVPMLWNLVTLRHEALENAGQARDKVTGVITGAESATLEPESGEDLTTPAVLLLHGFLSTRTDFADLAAQLVAEGFTVRIARLPGHGTTPTDLMEKEIDDYTRRALAEYDELAKEHEQVSVVGFSVGGALSLIVAAQREPHRVVIANPFMGQIVTPSWCPIDIETALPILSSALPRVIRPEEFARINRREGLAGHLIYRTVPLPAVERLAGLPAVSAAAGVPGKIQAPTLVLLSEQDHVVPSALGAALFEELPLTGGVKRLVRYARSDHILYRDHDGPDAVAETVRWLLAGD